MDFERGILQGRNRDSRIKKRVRFNSDSDVSIGHIGWQAFRTTVALFSLLLTRAMRGKKQGKRESRVTWRADNAGEMCTGIIFPGKCGVIEKKNENIGEEGREGKTAWRCMLQSYPDFIL